LDVEPLILRPEDRVILPDFPKDAYVVSRAPEIALQRGVGRVVKHKNAGWDNRFFVKYRDTRFNDWYYGSELRQLGLLEVLAWESRDESR
jgi:hypothetical protein